jgi:hypothetical protein
MAVRIVGAAGNRQPARVLAFARFRILVEQPAAAALLGPMALSAGLIA